MSFSLFKLILEKFSNKIKEKSKFIILGGGEPTVHPEFWNFFSYSLQCGEPWLATNGKLVDDVLALGNIAKKGLATVVLSQDKWHEKIDESVTSFFYENMNKKEGEWIQWEPEDKNDHRIIRTIINPYTSGRYKNGKKDCVCKLIKVEPNGNIRGCGCEDSVTIGNVYDGIFEEYSEVPFFDTCSKWWKFDKDIKKWTYK